MKAHLITILILDEEDMSNEDILHYVENAKFLYPQVVFHKIAEVDTDDYIALNDSREFKGEVERMQKENLFVDA